MIAAVAARGYPATTVADVVALAHVSRSTFYAHFASKRECLLATYEEIVRDSGQRVARAYRSQEEWHERLRAAFAAFMATVTSNPAAARLVIVEALALGQDIAEPRERSAQAFELLLRQSFERAPGGGPVAEATIRALVGGIRRVVYLHLMEGTPEGLPGLVGDLLDWALCYQLPADAAVGAPPDPPRARRRSPDGLCGESLELPQARLHYDQLQRIRMAVSQLVCQRGYSALTVPAISAAAGVSNQTFYELFADKQAAFLATFDDGALRAFATTQAAFESQPDWPAAIWAGVNALLAFLRSEPAFARLAFGELLGPGPPAYARAEAALDAFASFLDPARPLRPELPTALLKAIAGGVWSVVEHQVSHGQTDRLPLFAPGIVYVVLAPFIGAARAAGLVAHWQSAPVS
jgi:AcrR family transcriptional regulator